MFIKKQRIHQCGSTNIDFRTKRDYESINLFQPWKEPKKYGTMGNSLVKKTFDNYKEVMRSSSHINTNKDLNNEIPDPRFFSTAKFYSKHEIPMKKRNLYETEKVAELDESFKGKEKFTGDSMMIAANTKQKKAKNIGMDRLNQIQIIKRSKHNKKEINQNVDQETQLVTIKVSNTAENKVDIEKIRDIRMALRRRYANRTNFSKIFKDWDLSNNGEISLYDAHKMINSFGIPINFNETRALISTSRTHNKDTLDLDGFMNLIFSENPVLKIDNYEYCDETLLAEGEQTEMFKSNLRRNVGEVAKKQDTNFLKDFLRLRIPILVKKFKEFSSSGETKIKNEDHCDFETFQNLIQSFNMPLKYSSKDLLVKIFEEFKDPQENTMNYKNFLDHIVEHKDGNDFNNFKEKYLKGLQDKIGVQKKDLNELIEGNQHLIEVEKKLKNEKANVLKDQIERREKAENLNCFDLNYVRSSQPNKEFMFQTFKDKEEYSKIHNQIVKTFEPSYMISDLLPKTRFGGNPPHQNTFNNISTPFGCGQYISEKDRFNIRCQTHVDFIAAEKKQKAITTAQKIECIRKFNSFVKERNDVQEFLNVERKTYSLLQRTQKLEKYEKKNLIKNTFIE